MAGKTYPVTRANQLIGSYGERVAERHLKQLGYEIVDRNWRCALGEIDLVVAKSGRYSVVEVKTRRGLGSGHPLEAITTAKLNRLKRLAAMWTVHSGIAIDQVQIDAVSVLISGNHVLVDYRSAVTA